MGVGIKTGNMTTELGGSDFLHSFFSTISYHLEPNGWGTKYPVVLDRLYNEGIEVQQVPFAITEFKEIQQLLGALSPDNVVWDIDDLNLSPPWGCNISSSITNLSNYFVTSGGKNIFSVLFEMLEYAKEQGYPASIVTTPPYEGRQGEFYFINKNS